MNMEFTVPVTVTVTGWILVTAKNIEEAREKAAKLNVEGVPQSHLEDVEETSECMLDEIEEEV